jgi:hypothetical protein
MNIAIVEFPVPVMYAVGVVGAFQVGICCWMMWLLRQIRIVNSRPFWKAIQRGVAESLHHPHPESREMDKLLEQLENLTLDQWGTTRLKAMLRQKADNPDESPEERNRAEFLLFAMPMVVNEQAYIDQKKSGHQHV